jgi:ABC-type spermidine/putrescine transport system permease subunit II
MAMGNTILMASAMAAVNVLLLGTLTAVWVRNYRQFGSSMVAGLVAFGVVMLFENAAALYFFFSMRMLYSGDPGVQEVVMVLRGLQLVALAFLTYVTLK